MKVIADGRKWIDEYIENKDPKLGAVAQSLRRMVSRLVPGTTESVNAWKIPTFESNGPMCFFMVGKNHVTFGFLRGTSLPDPAKLLEGTGKSLRHVKLRTTEDLKKPGLKRLIQSAARLKKKRANSRYETEKKRR